MDQEKVGSLLKGWQRLDELRESIICFEAQVHEQKPWELLALEAGITDLAIVGWRNQLKLFAELVACQERKLISFEPKEQADGSNGLTCEDIGRLCLALAWEGYSTPQGLESSAVIWPELVRDLIRAVLDRKKRRIDAQAEVSNTRRAVIAKAEGSAG